MAAAFAAYLAGQVDADARQEEVLAYGALILVLHGGTLVLTLVLAWVAGLLLPVLVVAGVWALTRHATGGAHFSTPGLCMGATTATFLACGAASWWLLALAAHQPWVARVAAAAITLAGVLLVFRHAPAEAPQRALTGERRQSLRRLGRGLSGLIVSVVGVGAALDAWWVLPLSLGFLLQGVTLTPTGHRLRDAVEEGLTQFARKGGK